MSFTLNISVFGDKNVGKSKLIEDYTSQPSISKTKKKQDFISFQKTVDKIRNVLKKYGITSF